MKVVAIIQARMSSTRLPGKVMKEISGLPLIEILLNRIKKSKIINEIVLVTSTNPQNIELYNHVISIGFQCFRGSEDDVLDRYVQAAKSYKADIVVRITGDCPLVDSKLLDEMYKEFLKRDYDYLTNGNPPTFPDGLDIEIFKFKILEQSAQNDTSNYNKEHVTAYIRNSGLYKNGNFSTKNLGIKEDFSKFRFTVDEKIDLDVIKEIFDYFSPKLYFSWIDVIKYVKSRPDLIQKLKNIIRNEGSAMSKGQKLWKRAKSIIPGGNMLLSKRPEMFLPNRWPTYFSKAKGCKVWDLDGNCFHDLSIMGIGTNILGYGNEEVDEVVFQTINHGNMSTLNCPEEVWLAEKLIEIHPWADMVRFARSGGEANSIAIRIARAASGKDKVAVCGYHGWHDWYLSVNIGQNNGLDQHLLPGLLPSGVPESLKNTVYPFQYNNFKELEDIVNENKIGVIKMEVQRSEAPKDNFLIKVRELASSRGIVLIFDECTSGFRETFGGLHKKYGVEPDMAMFGKAMGNGYAITAVIGKSSVMDAAQKSFISSTFWTERIGPSAAIKSLEVMEREKSWETVTNIGKKIRRKWQELADINNINIIHSGLPALTAFNIDSKFSLEYKTLISQEMLKKGFLASNSIYVCTEHKDETLDEYFSNLSNVFAIIKQCEDGRPIKDFLETEVCHSNFRRLN